MIYFGREYCPAKDHQSSECPICSWVNHPNRSPPVSFDSFRKHSKNKGVIFYADRMSELATNPSLVTLSRVSSTLETSLSSAPLEPEAEHKPVALRRGNSRKRIRAERDSST